MRCRSGVDGRARDKPEWHDETSGPLKRQLPDDKPSTGTGGNSSSDGRRRTWRSNGAEPFVSTSRIGVHCSRGSARRQAPLRVRAYDVEAPVHARLLPGQGLVKPPILIQTIFGTRRDRSGRGPHRAHEAHRRPAPRRRLPVVHPRARHYRWALRLPPRHNGIARDGDRPGDSLPGARARSQSRNPIRSPRSAGS